MLYHITNISVVIRSTFENFQKLPVSRKTSLNLIFWFFILVRANRASKQTYNSLVMPNFSPKNWDLSKKKNEFLEILSSILRTKNSHKFKHFVQKKFEKKLNLKMFVLIIFLQKFLSTLPNMPKLCYISTSNPFIRPHRKNYINLKKDYYFWKTAIETFFATSTITGYSCCSDHWKWGGILYSGVF